MNSNQWNPDTHEDHRGLSRLRKIAGRFLFTQPTALASIAALALAGFLVAPVMADGGMPAAPAATLGKADTAKWTESTMKAASKPENKAVLEKGKVTTVTGEVVDVSCYLQLGKRGEAHIPCGSDCVRNGQPAGIVDADGKLTILMVEEHDPRRLGQIKITDQLASLLAKTITVTGMLTEQNGYRALYVQGSEIVAMMPPAAAPAK